MEGRIKMEIDKLQRLIQKGWLSSGSSSSCGRNVNFKNNCGKELKKTQQPFPYLDNMSDDCAPSRSEVFRLPKKPKLSKQIVNKLLCEETSDVEKVLNLHSRDLSGSRKPCPKKEAAQLEIKNIFSSSFRMIYLPQEGRRKLIEPDIDDITPEVAANIMFMEEQGTNLESCTDEVIGKLCPDLLGEDEEKRRSSKEGSKKDSRKQEPAKVGKSASKNDLLGLIENESDFCCCADKAPPINKIQLRGRTPDWFPGYYVIFPSDEVDEVDEVQVIKSPSQVFEKAWLSVNPNYFDDVIVINQNDC